MTNQWLTQAACKGHDPAIWFPPEAEPGYPNPITQPDWDTPRTICNTCPARTECATQQLEHEQPLQHPDQYVGMYGALTPTQRWNHNHPTKPQHSSGQQRPDTGTAPQSPEDSAEQLAYFDMFMHDFLDAL